MLARGHMYSHPAPQPDEPGATGATMSATPGNAPIAAAANGTGASATGNIEGPKVNNRYMKGRLPEGVDFAAYPGRSSTPLPTAESKSAERINQLKIWNEAATNDDKRRLNSAKVKGVSLAGGTPPTTRRTDSYKDAKDRHSASFHGAPPQAPQRNPIRTGGDGEPLPSKRDMFADRSDSESDDDDDYGDAHDSTQHQQKQQQQQQELPQQHYHQQQEQELVQEQQQYGAPSAQPHNHDLHYADDAPIPVDTAAYPVDHTSHPPESHASPDVEEPVRSPTKLPQSDPPPSNYPAPGPPPKESKGCCVIM